jgi:flagellar motility protein MotE (MotC chaperone)
MTTSNKTNRDKRQKKRRRSGRGALFILAAVFMMSAGARLMSGTGAAIARELSQSGVTETLKVNAEGGVCETDAETALLMASLSKREDRIFEDEKMLSRQMKALDLARLEFTKNIAELQDAEQRLAATMTIASSAARDDLDKLTAVYESMKPKDASALFEQMSPDFAAGFLGRMRSDAAASVLAGLKPETAYTISVILAGRNANAPRE